MFQQRAVALPSVAHPTAFTRDLSLNEASRLADFAICLVSFHDKKYNRYKDSGRVLKAYSRVTHEPERCGELSSMLQRKPFARTDCPYLGGSRGPTLHRFGTDAGAG